MYCTQRSREKRFISPDYLISSEAVDRGQMNLYDKYYGTQWEDRRELFRLVVERYHPTCGLYPGSFVHVTPSFYLPEMTYADTDKRARHFFRDGAARKIVEDFKVYAEEPRIEFCAADYRSPLPIEEGSIDLLISQFAGVISEPCARYLRPGGILLANDSHGDAGIANALPELELVGVVVERETHLELLQNDLHRYFVRKLPAPMPERADLLDYLKDLGRGLKYSVNAEHYLFRKL